MAWSCSYSQANQAQCMLAGVMLTPISMANAGMFYTDTTYFWIPRRTNYHIQYIWKQLTQMLIHSTPPSQTNRKQNSARSSHAVHLLGRHHTSMPKALCHLDWHTPLFKGQEPSQANYCNQLRPVVFLVPMNSVQKEIKFTPLVHQSSNSA